MTFVLNESWLRSLERSICALAAAATLIDPSVALGQTGSPCEALAARTIAPKLIALASGAATVTSAKIAATSTTLPTTMPPRNP